MLQKLKGWYADVKAWFLNSETIFLNRIEVLVGFALAAVAAMDWSPLWSFFGTGTTFNWKQIAGLGGGMVLRGVIGEWLRRRNAPLTSTGTLG